MTTVEINRKAFQIIKEFNSQLSKSANDFSEISRNNPDESSLRNKYLKLDKLRLSIQPIVGKEEVDCAALTKVRRLLSDNSEIDEDFTITAKIVARAIENIERQQTER